MGVIKRLSKSIREYTKDSILSPLFVSIEVVLECILPLVMSKLIDSIYVAIQTGKLDSVIKYGLILLVIAMASFACGVLSGVFCARGSAGFAKNLRRDVYEKVQQFSFANIDKFSTSSLVTRLTTDISNVQMAYMMIIRVAVRAPFMFIFSMVMAFTMNVKLTFIYLAIIPLLAGLLFFGVFYVHPIFEKVFKKYDALNNSVEENVRGMRVVKSYVREDYEVKKFHTVSNNVKKDFIKGEKIIALSSPAMQLAMYTALLLVNIFASVTIVKTFGGFDAAGNPVWGEFSTGKLQSFISYGMQMLSSLMMLSMILVMITISRASAVRIAEVLEEEPTLKNPENPIYEVENGSIEFNNVSFKYSEKAEKNALENINLKINSGETIGILGGTGSSKSSLIQLISRLYDATEGEVLVGGKNVKEYDLETLRNQVSVVLQKNVLFSGTIMENLRWGDKNASDEEVIRAAKLAQADDFIQNFSDKYDHYIEQGGSNVSGGQKQRLCIARALLKKPKILILDDSTSAVDTKTDSLIRKAFKEEIPNTTKIIIAQRVASVQDSDKIIVMNNGTIDAMGTHEELLKTNNIYQEVYYSQNKINKKENGGA